MNPGAPEKMYKEFGFDFLQESHRQDNNLALYRLKHKGNSDKFADKIVESEVQKSRRHFHASGS
jgi:hypothetical protein